MFERADHARLAEALGRLRGRFILSLNDVPAIRETFAGFATEAVETTYTINQGPAQPSRREPIITGP